MLAKIKKFDERHRSSQLNVTPLDETGLKVNQKSILAWEKYAEDYSMLKNEENTGEGEVFMRPMPSFLDYLQKQNFVEKQERKLKIAARTTTTAKEKEDEKEKGLIERTKTIQLNIKRTRHVMAGEITRTMATKRTRTITRAV